ncbi:amidohydrolase family protein [Pseudonocardia sp.]|uniref:amidohydrolase family protein n=1 Tax=Pseudonocardia sp. TaxID=60912 RepID=UPI00262CA82B|nr:amidohydrolase family protein [Pseudonocardia sp.]
MTLVDWHAHMLSDRLAPPSGAEGAWPGIRTAGGALELTLGGRPYRPVDARTFDPEPRLVDMDARGVAVQVLSPPPYAVAFDGPAAEFASLAEQQNAFLGEITSACPERFAMLGMLPYGEPARVTAEIERLEKLPGVRGVCLTAHRDDPVTDAAHEELWARFATNGWVVFVHPADTAMCAEDTATGAVFGLGMPLATARTATALVLSGMLAAVPRTRVLLAHAGGAFPATVDRLTRGWQLGMHPALAESPLATVRRSFWADALAYAPAPLHLAGAVFGADRLVYGSDYPFAAELRPAELESLHGDADLLARLTANGERLRAPGAGTGARSPEQP